ncbi:hypothetical protein OBRU01_07341 [Operophtera brumata]|uniref:Uncharacterized protein n=1 Tax=Operophtera brumata TaxID=104452 RepID=A0A0L7LCN9_OPEBR|nr:hypothetical protein OBRU01_07341 [Operophtera brumata]
MSINIGAIYNPGKKNNKFLEKYSSQIESRKRTIIFGDFNIDLLLGNPKDKVLQETFTKERKHMWTLITTLANNKIKRDTHPPKLVVNGKSFINGNDVCKPFNSLFSSIGSELAEPNHKLASFEPCTLEEISKIIKKSRLRL